MAVYYKKQKVDVWQVSKNQPYPDWVAEAFSKNIFRWVDDRLIIALMAFCPSTRTAFLGFRVPKTTISICGNGTYGLVEQGDYLDRTNLRSVTPEDFATYYRVFP